MSNVVCLSQQAQANGSWNAPYAVSADAATNILTVAQNADGAMEAFWCDTNNTIQYSWQTAPGATTWTPATPFINGPQASQLILCRNNQQQLTLFWIDLKNNVQVARQKAVGDQKDWLLEGFNQHGMRIAAYPNQNGLLELFIIGTDSKIYRLTQSGDLSWAPSMNATGWAGKEITLASNVDGWLELFYVGLNNLIYHAWQPSPNSESWQEGQLSGGAQKIVAGQNSNGTITIFYIGLDGYVYHNTQVPNVGA